jgi:hypothetical protein
MDMLKPSTQWCWPDGPREFKLPGASLDALARALAAEGSGALLLYRGWGYVLRWEDGPPGPDEQDAALAVRRYHLTSRHHDQAIRRQDELSGLLPGPFVQLAALPREDQGADLSGPGRTNLRDAIWWLLSKAGAALDAIG